MLHQWFLILAAVHAVLLVETWHPRFRPGWSLWFLRLLLLSLLIDNAAVAVGAGNLQEPWYQSLTRLRYGLHAFVLPGLALYGLSLLPAARPTVWLPVVAIAVGCLLYGAWFEIWRLGLQESPLGQVPRLVSQQAGPPLGTIGSNLLFLALAGLYWWRSGWPWAFLGGAAILVANAAVAGSRYALLVGAMAEVVFLASLLWTEARRRPIVERQRGEAAALSN